MVRHAIAVLAGATVTCALLWLTQAVIASPDAATDSGIEGRVLDFVQVQEDQEVIVKKRMVKSPPPPDPLPQSRPKPLPIVKVQPIYPRRAQTRCIEGHVLLEFVVTANGAVRDPVIVEAEPPGVFDRAAVDAALKFKYRPEVVNGEPIEVAGVRNLIKFELQNRPRSICDA